MIKSEEKVRFTFRLPNHLFQQIKSQSDNLGVSINALMLQILWDWVGNQENV